MQLAMAILCLHACNSKLTFCSRPYQLVVFGAAVLVVAIKCLFSSEVLECARDSLGPVDLKAQVHKSLIRAALIVYPMAFDLQLAA